MRAPLLTLCLFLGLAGCTKATIIGTACTKTTDCNVKGQVCAPGFGGGPTICTRTCTGETGPTGCPVGYDCYPTDMTLGSTCNKTLYEVTATGDPLLFGVDCATDDTVCATLGSTNAAVSCRKIEDPSTMKATPNDPNAYCTGVCSSDADCPLDFECDTDYDKAKKCLRRALCSECVTNDNCPTEFPLCVPTTDGSARYCTKSCQFSTDCGGVQNSAFVCMSATDATNTTQLSCLHRFGACVGSGNVCDPCRSDADCAHAGNECYTNVATGEEYCIKSCKTDADCTPVTAGMKVACDNTDIYDATTNPDGMSTQTCSGNYDHTMPGLLSCWYPL